MNEQVLTTFLVYSKMKEKVRSTSANNHSLEPPTHRSYLDMKDNH